MDWGGGNAGAEVVGAEVNIMDQGSGFLWSAPLRNPPCPVLQPEQVSCSVFLRAMARCLLPTICIALAACTSGPPTEKVLRDKVHEVDLIVDYFPGPALSPPKVRVSVVEKDGGRDVIFEGYHGLSPVALKSSKKGTLVLAYCGGVIRSVGSFLVKDESSGTLLAVTVQPIVAPNVQIGGETVCGEV